MAAGVLEFEMVQKSRVLTDAETSLKTYPIMAISIRGSVLDA